MRQILIFLVCTVLFSGSAMALTLVENCVDLQNIQNNPTETYEIVNDIDCSDTINWNSGSGFSPIGGFTGTLEGNNYVISDLYINRTSAGMFGYLCGSAIIRNVRFINATIIVDSVYGDGGVLLSEGGCVPASNIIIDNIYAEGNVYGGANEYVGGLIGRVNREVTLSNSRFVGYVEGAGGLIGQNDGNVINSSFNGIVNGTLITINAGPNYDKIGLTGGFIGWNFGTIRNSFSEGTVTGLNNVGGFVGGDEYVNETWRGEIFDSYSTADVTGLDYVGGFIGYNVGGDIVNSYSTGSVFGSGNYVEGLVGWNNGAIINSYWDTETSGQNTSAGGVGKTTVEMMQQTTFAGWDFADSWRIEEGLSYPYLKWQTPPVLDSDGDGINDDEDNCPLENALGFDADLDGCIDTLSGLAEMLEALVNEGVIEEELQNSLLSKVENAEKSADKENICAAVNKLEALINQTNAQRGNKISDEAADLIIAYANNLIANLLNQLPSGESC